MKQRHLRKVRVRNFVAGLGLPLLMVAALGSSGACASLAGLSSFAEGDGVDGSVTRGSDALAPGAADDASTGTGEPPATDDSTGDATTAPGDDGSTAPGDDGSTAAGDDGSGNAAGDDSGNGTGDGAAARDGAADAHCGNVSTDENNCGSCGYVCATGTTCTGGQCKTSSTSAYLCSTPLAHTPVCASNHHDCLCTDDSECNSNGLNVVNNGGCNSGRCSGTCKGGQFTDSAGCSIVAPTCNLGGSQGCPAKTVCEVNHGGCGGNAQCCWCTSDSACPVSGKCVNDPTQNQCNGQGPCTGSGSSYDGMHCQLASPGIPLCTTQYSCSVGNCDDVTSSSGTCGAAGTACWCTADAQCPKGKCASWAGCAAGACSGQSPTDSFNCAR